MNTQLVIILFIFSLVVEDDDNPPICRRLIVFSPLGANDNDELRACHRLLPFFH